MKYYAIYSIRDKSICGTTTSFLLDDWSAAYPMSYLWFNRANNLHEISSEVHDVLASLFSEIRQSEVHWIHHSDSGVTCCPACNWSIEENFYDPSSGKDYPFCPNCGQPMSNAKGEK